MKLLHETAFSVCADCKQNLILELTLGVCPFTFPARAKDPCTLPPRRGTDKSNTNVGRASIHWSSFKGVPPLYSKISDAGKFSNVQTASCKSLQQFI